MVNYTYPKNLAFECTRCASCCMDTETHVRRIFLLEEEAKRISLLSRRPMEKFTVETVGYEPYAYEMKKTMKDRKCVFLASNVCSIYAIRPLVCRFYPFQLNKGRRKKYSFSVTTECPGVARGKVLRNEFFENLFQQTCKNFDGTESAGSSGQC